MKSLVVVVVAEVAEVVAVAQIAVRSTRAKSTPLPLLAATTTTPMLWPTTLKRLALKVAVVEAVDAVEEAAVAHVEVHVEDCK